jgi:hypothetical protein
MNEGTACYTVYKKLPVASLLFIKYKAIYFVNEISYSNSNDVFHNMTKGIIVWNPYSRR